MNSGFEEEEKGSIKSGKLVDFMILDNDIMQVPLEDISNIKVVNTFINDELVYN